MWVLTSHSMQTNSHLGFSSWLLAECYCWVVGIVCVYRSAARHVDTADNRHYGHNLADWRSWFAVCVTVGFWKRSPIIAYLFMVVFTVWHSINSSLTVVMREDFAMMLLSRVHFRISNSNTKPANAVVSLFIFATFGRRLFSLPLISLVY